MALAYKVVAKDNGRLFSWGHNVLNDFSVEYIPGVLTFPKVKNTYLFAFKTLDDALCFASSTDEIWECEVDIHDGPFYRGNIGQQDLFWEIYNSSYEVVHSLEVWYIKNGDKIVGIFKPDSIDGSNSLFCKSIKLIKRIER